MSFGFRKFNFFFKSLMEFYFYFYTYFIFIFEYEASRQKPTKKNVSNDD